MPTPSVPSRQARRLSFGKLVVSACALIGGGITQAQNSAPGPSGRQGESAAGRPMLPARAFAITGFDIDNQAGADVGLLQQVQARFDTARGAERTVADVTAARLATQAVLDQAAPGKLAVNVPEQTLSNGRIKVVIAAAQAGRMGGVAVVEAPGFGSDNVRASVPALATGSTLDVAALDRQLRLGELNPFKRTNVTLGVGPDGAPAAVVSAQAERSRLYYLTSDNFGPRGSRGRVGAGFIDGNLTGRDDVLSLNYVTAFEPKRLKGLNASYALPFYGYGQMLELNVSRSESDSGNTIDLFHINGSGTSVSAKWSYLLLARQAGAGLRLTAGYLYHRTNNQVTFNALSDSGSLIPSGSTAPLSVGLEGDFRPADMPVVVKGAITISRNFAGALGSTSKAGLGAIRRDAGNFTLIGVRLQADAEAAGGWQLRGRLQGQITPDALTATDQLNIAGPYAVRGMRDAGLLGDKALVLNTETATPVLVQHSGVSLRGWGFADYGTVRRNHALPGELSSADISSVGLGLRASATWGSLDLYLARKIAGNRFDSDAGRSSAWLSALVRY